MNNYDHLIRQFDLVPVSALNIPISIIGVGAIGSFTALALAKMGFENITVWDDDVVSIENMNCQFFRRSDIGENKAKALAGLIKDFTDVDIIYNETRYESGPLRGIVISAVDSMEARKNIWNNAKKSMSCKLFVDPRMSAEFAMIFALEPSDEKMVSKYERTLYSDGEAVQERCTAKATIYTVQSISGHVAKVAKDFITQSQFVKECFWDLKVNDQQNT